MSRPLSVTAIESFMEAVLPRQLGEVAVGDLVEEYRIRARTMSPAKSALWFAWQAGSSLPRLLLMSAKPLPVLLSLGVAGVCFYLLGFAEHYMHVALDAVYEPPTFFWLLISNLAVGFTACACGGFLSTSLRRGSAAIYSLIGTALIVSDLPHAGSEVPVWFAATFVVVAFVAPITGGAAFVALARRFPGRFPSRGDKNS